jgi:hypothetical protein
MKERKGSMLNGLQRLSRNVSATREGRHVMKFCFARNVSSRLFAAFCFLIAGISPAACTTEDGSDGGREQPASRRSGADRQIGSVVTLSADASANRDRKPAPPEHSQRWPWELDEEFAAGRRQALTVLDEHGGVYFSQSLSDWWNIGRVDLRPVPLSLQAPRVGRLVDSVKFTAGSVQGAPSEDDGVPIPDGVDEIVDVPDDVDDKLLLAHLPYVPDCRILVLELTRVTNEGLGVIKSLPYLDSLFIEYGWTHRYPVLISDEGMRHIGRHPALARLRLRGMPVTDQGIAALSRCATLERLHVTCCPITEECFLSLQHLPKLEVLTIGYSPDVIVPKSLSPDFSQPVSPEVAAAVASFDGRLKVLHLEGLEVHPSLLRAIGKIKSLTYYRGPQLPDE